MERVRVIVGLVIVILVIGGLIGAAFAIDARIDIEPDRTAGVTVERINETHAAVAWTTEDPTYGDLHTAIRAQCNSGVWLEIKSINDSSFSRRHLVVAPIYELNRSRIQPTVANITYGPWKQQPWRSPVQYKVAVNTYHDRSEGSNPLFIRNIGQGCQ